MPGDGTPTAARRWSGSGASTRGDDWPDAVRQDAARRKGARTRGLRRDGSAPGGFSGLETVSYDGSGNLIALEISGVPFFGDDGALPRLPGGHPRRHRAGAGRGGPARERGAAAAGAGGRRDRDLGPGRGHGPGDRRAGVHPALRAGPGGDGDLRGLGAVHPPRRPRAGRDRAAGGASRPASRSTSSSGSSSPRARSGGIQLRGRGMADGGATSPGWSG